MQVNLTDSCENILSTSSNSRQHTHSRSVAKLACGIHCAHEHHNVCPRRLSGGGLSCSSISLSSALSSTWTIEVLRVGSNIDIIVSTIISMVQMSMDVPPSLIRLQYNNNIYVAINNWIQVTRNDAKLCMLYL